MSDLIYRPLIEDMTWSYSRLKCFEDCPYRWYLLYIAGQKEEKKFYSEYGHFMHDLLARFYLGLIDRDGMIDEYLTEFESRVKGERPAPNVVSNYVTDGLRFLRAFDPLPLETVGIEKRVRFTNGNDRFIGFVDLIGRDKDGLVVVDHKSRAMKKRSGRAKPTMKDAELDEMLRQLYLYAAGVRQAYGEFPKKLCFNAFRSGLVIEEPFKEKAYNETLRWAAETAEKIRGTSEFRPKPEFYKCRYICGVDHLCCYYDEGRGI